MTSWDMPFLDLNVPSTSNGRINTGRYRFMGLLAKMLSILFSITLLLPWANAQVAMPDISNVTTSFSSAMIVPDVLPSFNPVDAVDVTFSDTVTMEDINVVPGILLTTEETAMFPSIILTPSNSSGSSDANATAWVVALVDPDAPTPQNRSISQFLHFLGGDFAIDDTGLLSNTSPALMEFTPPAPPPGSDPHRYVLLVFDQPDNFDTEGSALVNSTTPRTNFNIGNFAQAVDLGSPIAGNYFLVGPMASVAPPITSGTPAPSAPSTDIPTVSPNTLTDTSTGNPTTTNTNPSAPTSGGVFIESRQFLIQSLVLSATILVFLYL